MKRLLLALFFGINSIFVVSAYTKPDFSKFIKIPCELYDVEDFSKNRSTVRIPNLYQSEEYILIQSDGKNYNNAHITVTDSQGETVKDDIIQVTAGGDNLYYIGDLDGGAYDVIIETDSFTIYTNIFVY